MAFNFATGNELSRLFNPPLDSTARLNRIRELLINNMNRSDMSPRLKELLGSDELYCKHKLRETPKIMDDETRINEIKEIIIPLLRL